jgi:GNAT superfamily N-acetyltransferase
MTLQIDLQIEKIHDLTALDLVALRQDSQRSGVKFVQRLVDDWISGKNLFNQLGEAFFVAKQPDRLIGICGLNQDPYTATPTTGRVRRLYVMQADRRQGVGRALVQRVITEARPTFEWLHIRTDNPVADRFYRSLGFTPYTRDSHVTHRLNLGLTDLISR